MKKKIIIATYTVVAVLISLLGVPFIFREDIVTGGDIVGGGTWDRINISWNWTNLVLNLLVFMVIGLIIYSLFMNTKRSKSRK